MPNHSCAKPMADDPPRTIADLWDTFRRQALHGHADDNPALAQAKTVFYSGALGCFRVLCVVLAETETNDDVPIAVGRIRDELEHWGNVFTGEIKVQ